MTTRAEHLKWCKDRANEYLELGDKNQALASFMSDMSKHEETATHAALQMGMMLLVTGNLSTTHEMKNWIDGFN